MAKEWPTQSSPAATIQKNYIYKFLEESSWDNGREPVFPVSVLIIIFFTENHGKKRGLYKERT